MNWTLRLIAVFCLVPLTSFAQNIVGDWQGTLNAGPAQLHLVVHISKDPRGALKATMDSLNQGALGIPMSAVGFQAPKLTFSIASIEATYDGNISADGNLIKGIFTQGQAFPLDLSRITRKVAPSDIDGMWLGTLDAGMMQLRLAFHFFNTTDGLKGSLDSLDQAGSNGLPISTITRDGESIKLVMNTIGGTFEGKVHADRGTIEGTFTQNANPIPLVVKRVKDPAELQGKRPQTPVKPYPYREEEVSYENKAAHVRLAGTFTIPSGKGPFPAVLLITGSGPQDRDETIKGHKPFLVLADYLTRQGIAVLRVDDRGIGESTGHLESSTTADLATDVEAGIAWLKTRDQVAKSRIGLIGHSEGGVIAPMVAARNRDVAFIVMLAGSAVRGEDLIVGQVIALDEAAGMKHDDALKAGAGERAILKLVESEKDPEKLKQKLASKIPAAQLDEQVAALNSPWYRYFLEYDPAPALRQVKCPVLALNGAKDVQVPAAQNLAVISKELKAGGNQNFETVEMPGLNHLFQTAKTGLDTEYAQIEETIAPAVLEKIASWILALKPH